MPRYIYPPDTDSDTTINGDNISQEATGRYLGRHTSSIDNASQSDTASDEAIELQRFGQVHQLPNTDNDVASIGNISEEAMQRYLGEHTGSIVNASQSDTASEEAKELRGLAQVHQLPNADNDVASIGNVSEDAMGRYLGEHTGSIVNASQSDTASEEAKELRGLAQVHQLPNADNDVASIGNVSEDAMGRYLGEHTGSIVNASQSDTASEEAKELRGLAQVHQLPNADNDVASIGNVSEDAMGRYLGEHTGSIVNASQSNTASHEAIELQALAQVHLPPNTDNVQDDALSFYDNVEYIKGEAD